jgi:hypothetical protein
MTFLMNATCLALNFVRSIVTVIKSTRSRARVTGRANQN